MLYNIPTNEKGISWFARNEDIDGKAEDLFRAFVCVIDDSEKGDGANEDPRCTGYGKPSTGIS